MKGSAYTPVPARRTLGPERQETSKQIVWPQAVRDYVSRSFDADYETYRVTRDDISAKLKVIISAYAQSNTMELVDWASMPLPHEIIALERPASTRTSPAPNPSYSVAPIYSYAAAAKRSSADAGLDNSDSPPWRKTNRSKKDERPNGLKADTSEPKNSKYITSLEQRRQRFESSPVSPPHSARQTMAETTQGHIVGTCQDLEKKYLRLTSAPIPSLVRPQPVLEKTLNLLKKKWKKDGDYGYICDQFKSVRQDMMVQHIKNSFTVTVYEIHARIALEKGDLGEYKQCQTQLQALYKLGLKGHPEEFLAYRILHCIYSGNQLEISNLLVEITAKEKAHQAVQHALQVKRAISSGNYHQLFQLYLDTPNMGAYLMDTFCTRERLNALCRITRGYKGKLTLRFLTEELGFESDPECAKFLLDYIPVTHFVQVKGEAPCITSDLVAYKAFEEGLRKAPAK